MVLKDEFENDTIFKNHSTSDNLTEVTVLSNLSVLPDVLPNYPRKFLYFVQSYQLPSLLWDSVFIGIEQQYKNQFIFCRYSHLDI